MQRYTVQYDHDVGQYRLFERTDGDLARWDDAKDLSDALDTVIAERDEAYAKLDDAVVTLKWYRDSWVDFKDDMGSRAEAAIIRAETPPGYGGEVCPACGEPWDLVKCANCGLETQNKPDEQPVEETPRKCTAWCPRCHEKRVYLEGHDPGCACQMAESQRGELNWAWLESSQSYDPPIVQALFELRGDIKAIEARLEAADMRLCMQTKPEHVEPPKPWPRPQEVGK